jgi:hypothetical protein
MRSCSAPRGDGGAGGARTTAVDGELAEEAGGRGKHLLGGIGDRRLGLQVVTTRRRVGEVLWGGSMEEEGSRAVVLAVEPRRRQRAK